MTSHAGRLYALAVALAAFFILWAAVAARPWSTGGADAQLRALGVREAQLRREAALVHQVVAERNAAYRSELRLRRMQIAAAQSSSVRALAAVPTAPAVRVVTLPPLTITRTS